MNRSGKGGMTPDPVDSGERVPGRRAMPWVVASLILASVCTQTTSAQRFLVAGDSLGNLHIAGALSSDLEFGTVRFEVDPDTARHFYIRLDASGNPSGHAVFGRNGLDHLSSLVTDGTGRPYLAIYFHDGFAVADADGFERGYYFLALRGDGGLRWAATVGTWVESVDLSGGGFATIVGTGWELQSKRVHVDLVDGAVMDAWNRYDALAYAVARNDRAACDIVAGFMPWRAWVACVDGGADRWELVSGGDDSVTSVLAVAVDDRDGDILLIARNYAPNTTLGAFPAGSASWFAARIDPSGQVLWLAPLEVQGLVAHEEWGRPSLMIEPDGTVVASVGLRHREGGYQQEPEIRDDTMVWSLGPDGRPLSQFLIEGLDTRDARQALARYRGDTVVAGWVADTEPSLPSCAASTRYSNLIVVFVGGCVTTESEPLPAAGFTIMVYPNPVNGVLRARVAHAAGGSFDWALVDILGRRVLSSHEPSNGGALDMRIPVGDLAPGVYLLRVEDARGSLGRTFVVAH